MKTLCALIFPFAALAFSAITQAAPVQYQVTATHTQETDISHKPVSANDYFFADGTTITATFYYDATTPAAFTNYPDPTGGAGLFSSYGASSNFSFVTNTGYSLYATGGGGGVAVIDANTTSSQDFVVVIAGCSAPCNSNFDDLVFGGYTVTVPTIAILGSSDMLPSQALPNSLIGLNSNNIVIELGFSHPNDYTSNGMRWVTFENGTISQVPLPSSALFFLSGLVGLGANIFKKAKK